MGTGRKRANTSQTTVTTRATKKDASKGTEAGSAEHNGQQPQLQWTFMLENPVTRVIREIAVGASIQGQQTDSTVLVTSHLGVLGRAPQGIGRRIIKALQNIGGSLRGTVLEHHRTTVKVELHLQ